MITGATTKNKEIFVQISERKVWNVILEMFQRENFSLETEIFGKLPIEPFLTSKGFIAITNISLEEGNEIITTVKHLSETFS